MDEAKISAGFARRTINPPRGILTIGYGDLLKGNHSVHDDLTATVILLEHGETAHNTFFDGSYKGE